MIETFVITTLSLLLGYYLGSKQRIDLKESVKEIKRKIEVKTSPVGPVNRPDAKRLESWKDTPEAQETEEMKKLLDKVVEKNVVL